MTTDDVKNSALILGDSSSRPFNSLGLTLSAKGWTASIQWRGTYGARGNGKTIEDALNNALTFARVEWNAVIVAYKA